MVATLLGNSIKVQMWNVLDMRSLDDSKVRKGSVCELRVWMTSG